MRSSRWFSGVPSLRPAGAWSHSRDSLAAFPPSALPDFVSPTWRVGCCGTIRLSDFPAPFALLAFSAWSRILAPSSIPPETAQSRGADQPPRSRPCRFRRGESWRLTHATDGVSQSNSADASLALLVFKDLPNGLVLSLADQDVGCVVSRIDDARRSAFAGIQCWQLLRCQLYVRGDSLLTDSKVAKGARTYPAPGAVPND
jgi:hypothetical protein